MQWLMKFRVLWGIRKPYRGFHPAPGYLRCQSLSGVGALRWNDYDVPEEFNFASDVLDYWTQMEKEGKRGPNPALWLVNNQGDELKWSFGELTDLSRRAANVLTQTCGLQQGDRLALILPRVPEWWLVVIGCIRAGIIFMPGTIQLKAKDILYRLQASKAKGIVTTDTLAPEVDSLASECPTLKTKLLVSDHSHQGWLDLRSLIKSASPDHTCIKSKTVDPMAIFFTSGTTGFPKMVKHCHGFALRSSLPSCRKMLQLKTSDILWCFSDTGWILALCGCIMEPWAVGATLFIHHLPQFDPKVIEQMLLKYPITHSLAVPLVYRMILRHASTSLRFPTLEHCITGGEALLPEDQEEWRRRTGLLLYEIYGQTETGISCGTPQGMKIKPGSMGKSIPPFDIQIIDDQGNTLPFNTEGNIGIRMKPTRPIGLFMGYEDNPVKTAEVECGDFYNCGDRATMDEEGYIWFLGRKDDIITASGYRIGPAEVENALAEHPAVAESAVVSSPDPIRREVVKAFIVLTPEFLSHDRDQLTKELQQHVKSLTAPYKHPRKVEFVSELPKTITGKIKRSDLRKKEFGQM
ncbi:acyl-coenzyme A synthetase ACSM1, mitochondrial [Ursus americanus]|uniref:medium-chain acyl-CoA ligase n=2 Tax=Ursus TaxID=9639 RepID=A0A452TRH6_URSMA|nr:acyl-coenzyme A synthetase ACSM1, mitochondrial [Ursus arctos]XP_026375993.1 acyl-coenzyme A synthetase ACSM1, mitochondrial [Ursus arctos]XP_026375994.1 acyl-coenzyme A synthetase ACSM1, mitochondrial [Ursus arctos]XP_045626830.1 acyl-coenzyme A synthetase ACSM1, mitochondrial [Ursus americanus]XP_045626831.1 acyl-coenzyme A synthetase ACSM1, mitochondrial [Ursus americanus]XP_045626832.1 acyl-coenzyme A synthetase ACSM1, mitochondrial [Ursus americanus]XP_048080771.1 acyl-coenzyme A synt